MSGAGANNNYGPWHGGLDFHQADNAHGNQQGPALNEHGTINPPGFEDESGTTRMFRQMMDYMNQSFQLQQQQQSNQMMQANLTTQQEMLSQMKKNQGTSFRMDGEDDKP